MVNLIPLISKESVKAAIWKVIKISLLCALVWLQAETILAQTDRPRSTAPRAKKDQPPLPLVEIERFGCLGACPAYIVSFFPDGRVAYYGGKYVKLVGEYERKLKARVLNELKQLLSVAQRNRYRTSYSDEGCASIFTDYPWTIFRLNFRGRVKTIERSHGCFGGSDEFKKQLSELDKLEENLGKLARLQEWIGTEEERKKLEYHPSL